MSDRTDVLIRELSRDLRPVARLQPPWRRAIGLSAGATLLLGLVVVVRGVRSDIGEQLSDAPFLVSLASAWLTGATATLAALEVGLPDRSRLWLWLPLPPLVLWISGIGWGCLAHWASWLGGQPIVDTSLRCLITLFAASLPLTVGLWSALRRARPLRQNAVVWLAATAIAAFADVAHLVCHKIEATALVLTMNLGFTAVTIVALGLCGRGFLWRLGA